MTISLIKDLTESVGVPRSIFVKWPLGHPLGEAFNKLQHRTMIFHSLQMLCNSQTPGIILEPGFRWRREQYDEPDWTLLKECEN